MSERGEAMWADMIHMSGAAIEFRIERVRLDPGRSFSEEAMSNLVEDFAAWVGTRVMRRWDATGEPPTTLVVTLGVEVQ